MAVLSRSQDCSRPVSTGRPLAPTGLPDGEKRKDLLGLFSKYNLEYRRPYPQHRNIAGMDVWKTFVEAPCDSPFTSEDFRGELRDFSETQIWDQADWYAWDRNSAKSSMIVPMKDGASSSSSAVGDKRAQVKITPGRLSYLNVLKLGSKWCRV